MGDDNITLWVRYKDYRAVAIYTHVDSKMKRRDVPLRIVDNFIKAVKEELTPLLDSIPIVALTLHSVVDGRGALELRSGQSLAEISGKCSEDNPLIITNRHDMEDVQLSRQASPGQREENCVPNLGGEKAALPDPQRHLAEELNCRPEPNSGLFRAVTQEFGYMINNGNQYGVLSTWESTWFFKRGEDSTTSNIPYISDCVRWDSTGVTFFKALACIAKMARQSPHLESKPSRQPPPTSQLIGGPSSSSSSLNRNVGPRPESTPNSAPGSPAPHRSWTDNTLSSLNDTSENLLKGLSEKTLTDSEPPLKEPFTSWLPLCDILGRALGYGRCGYVCECLVGGVLSAVKLIDPNNERSGKSLYEAVLRESEAYDNLRELQSLAIPRLILPAFDYLGMVLLATELASEGVCKSWSHEEKQMAEKSLRMIHARGYIHGDIRRENVVFHVEGGVRKALWVDLETCQLGEAEEFEREIRW
ncbi:hypothetical protein HDU76_007118, partial [Blyttiomyces sp. JEL0837]